jgi:hypothetical protein
MSRIESGLYPVSDSEISHYLGWCHVPPEEVAYVQDLKTTEEQSQGFWTRDTATGPLPPSLRSLIYHESTADQSISYEQAVVPGLLQIEQYAAAMFRSRSGSESSISTLVRGRMDRQTVLSRPNPAEFVFFIHEQALLLQVGNAIVMQDQLLHLVFSSARHNVCIRVVPMSAGERSVCGNSFRLFEYEKKEHRPLVYLDTWSGAFFVDDPATTAEYRRLAKFLADIALPEGQSVELLADMASGYDDRVKGEAHAHLEEEQL